MTVLDLVKLPGVLWLSKALTPGIYQRSQLNCKFDWARAWKLQGFPRFTILPKGQIHRNLNHSLSICFWESLRVLLQNRKLYFPPEGFSELLEEGPLDHVLRCCDKLSDRTFKDRPGKTQVQLLRVWEELSSDGDNRRRQVLKRQSAGFAAVTPPSWIEHRRRRLLILQGSNDQRICNEVAFVERDLDCLQDSLQLHP